VVVESILRLEGGGEIEEGERGRLAIGGVAMSGMELCKLLACKPVHRDDARMKDVVTKISSVRFPALH
jgi:hypothetical protein